MAWTTPRTWATGDPLSSTYLNAHIRDNLNYLYGNVPPAEFGVADILNNSNTETTFATTTVAAGSLGTTGGMMGESWFVWVQQSGGAINYTWRLKLGATTIFAWTYSVTSTANLYTIGIRYAVGNMESASAQRAIAYIDLQGPAAISQTTANGLSGSYVMHNTAAENTAGALAFAITCQMASATATGYVYHLGSRLFAPLT